MKFLLIALSCFGKCASKTLKVRKALMSFLKRSFIFSPNSGKTEKKKIVGKRSMDSNTNMTTTTTTKSKTNTKQTNKQTKKRISLREQKAMPFRTEARKCSHWATGGLLELGSKFNGTYM